MDCAPVTRADSSGKHKQADREERHEVESSSSDDEDDFPDEVCVDVGVVACKAGTTLFEAPLLRDP